MVRGARLNKRDAELLLAALETPSSDLDHYLAVLRNALAYALCKALDQGKLSWTDVVEQAAAKGKWPRARVVALVGLATEPGVIDAHTDLVTELAELRQVTLQLQGQNDAHYANVSATSPASPLAGDSAASPGLAVGPGGSDPCLGGDQANEFDRLREPAHLARPYRERLGVHK